MVTLPHAATMGLGTPGGPGLGSALRLPRGAGRGRGRAAADGRWTGAHFVRCGEGLELWGPKGFFYKLCGYYRITTIDFSVMIQ